MTRTIWLQTSCETELWAGFFGIDETGRQPECDQEILEELEEDGTMRPCYSVQCPKCKTWLEWPHRWELLPQP